MEAESAVMPENAEEGNSESNSNTFITIHEPGPEADEEVSGLEDEDEEAQDLLGGERLHPLIIRPAPSFKPPAAYQASYKNIVPGNYQHRYSIYIAVTPHSELAPDQVTAHGTKRKRPKLQEYPRSGNPSEWVSGNDVFAPSETFARLLPGQFPSPREACERARDFLTGRGFWMHGDEANRILTPEEAMDLEDRQMEDHPGPMFRGWVRKEDGTQIWVKTVADVWLEKQSHRVPEHERPEENAVYLVYEQRAVPRPEQMRYFPQNVRRFKSRDKKGTEKNDDGWQTWDQRGRLIHPPENTLHPDYLTAPTQLGIYTSIQAANVCAIGFFRQVMRPCTKRIDDANMSLATNAQLDRLTYEGIPREPVEIVFEAWKWPEITCPFRWIRVTVSKGWIEGPDDAEAQLRKDAEEKHDKARRNKINQMRRAGRQRWLELQELEEQLRRKEIGLQRREEKFRVYDKRRREILRLEF